MDVGPLDGAVWPLLNPFYGFASISAPEFVIDTQDINEGNWLFSRKVVKRASSSTLTLSQGVTFYNSDFWHWVLGTITGNTDGFSLAPGQIPLSLFEIGGPTYRRNLILIQYFSRLTFGDSPFGEFIQTLTNVGIAAGLTGLEGASAATVATLATTTVAKQGLVGGGLFEFAARIPAKAYILKGVIPVRYKSGSDFDAQSSAIHVAELDLAVETWEEVSLAG